MIASDWQDEFIVHLDEENNFYHANYYAGSNDCEEDLKVYIDHLGTLYRLIDSL